MQRVLNLLNNSNHPAIQAINAGNSITWEKAFLLIQERLNCKQQKVAPSLFLNPLEPELKLTLVNFISLLLIQKCSQSLQFDTTHYIDVTSPRYTNI